LFGDVDESLDLVNRLFVFGFFLLLKTVCLYSLEHRTDWSNENGEESVIDLEQWQQCPDHRFGVVLGEEARYELAKQSDSEEDRHKRNCERCANSGVRNDVRNKY